MENGFSGRSQWINPQAQGAAPGFQPNSQPGLQMPLQPGASLNNGGMPNPGLSMSNGMMTPQFAASSMAGFPQSAQVMQTPSSGSYPLLGLDISSQMFMQAMNFERMLQATGGQQQGMGEAALRDSAMNGVLNRSVNDSQRSDASLDLIEQRQAMEQTRLLERFKQMRLWQQQQQEMLMNQQQNQLMQLKKEQERVQGLITRQRDQQWGSGRPNNYDDMSTPPRRQLPPGTDMAQLMAGNSQAKGLPKPVIYVQPKEDDDEIKTNPDLFSDTNSNRGSQAGVEEGMFPIPDSASEASVDVGDIQLRQQIKQHQQSQQYQQRFNPHELDAPKKLHRSFAELETSEDFINQSYQSPTVFEKHQEKIVGKDEKAMSEICEGEEGNDDDDYDDDENSDDEDDDDEDNDESYSEEESQENTQIEVKQGSNIDDVPIKPGVDGTKTFEQLLEEQMRAEEERLKQEAEGRQGSSKPKKTFLKKGEGIARFDSKPGQRSGRPRKSQKSVSTNQKTAGQGTNQKTGAGSSSANTGTQKSSTGTGTSQSQKTGKTKPPINQKSKVATKPGAQTGAMNKTKKDAKGKTVDTKSPTKSKDGIIQEKGQGDGKKAKRADSIPDDASFIASLNERQKDAERDMEELDEFEILEHFADNMSFCSNSSIVTKGLKGLQSDRILAGKLPTQSMKVGSVSPRSALIKKLEAERQERQKKVNVINTDRKTVNTDRNTVKTGLQDSGKRTESLDANRNNNSNEEVKNGDNENDDDDEYESVSDSSEESSSEDDDDEVQTKQVTSSLTQANLDDPGNNRNLHRLSSVQNVNDSIKDASVLSTEKKLERALSYTGMTETSESRESESDRGIDSDEETETDESDSSENDDDFTEEKSLPKIVTRKVATKISSNNQLSVPTVGDSADFFSSSFNSSAFVPKMKSPIVISKEKISFGEMDFKSKPNFPNIEDTKFSYHSDTDSVGNSKKDLSDVEDNDNGLNTSKSNVLSEKKTLQFDDDDEWGDSSPLVNKKRHDSSDGDNDHDKTLSEEIETQMAKLDFNKVQASEKTDSDTPPTSKLVAKLFPKLKPQQKKQEEQDMKKVQTVSQAEVGDGVQSKVLRDKLVELEREIEKFRNENSHLAKLRTEREEGLAMLKKEITEFEKEKNEELKRLEEFKNEEMKKLKHERKVFEKYQKAARAGPDKKEREEIENLKTQVQELQDELKKKESRWTSNNARLRGKIDQLEQENEELKEEIKLLEKKRLDWMQKDKGMTAKNKSAGQIRSSTPTMEEMEDQLHNGHLHDQLNGQIRSSTPTIEEREDQLHNGHLHDQLNDMSIASSIKSNIIKPSQSQPKVNVHSSFPPGSRPATSQSSTGNQQSQYNKNNVNQSSKSSSVNSVKSGNQSKKAPVQQKTGNFAQNQGQNKLGVKQTGKLNSLPGKGGGDKNILRNSLNEDVPRTATFAQHQDVSMYSEGEGEMSVHMSTNLPRKLATKMGVDRSVIDKGNDTSYEETQHSDGKLERVYRNGAREILFSNGTRKEISSDGQSIVVSFFNGDVKQIMPDQRVIYYYAEAQTTTTNYPDGLEILQFPNNQIEKLYADGTREITFPDQTVKYIFPNGSEESIFQDGLIIRLEKNGDKIMEFPNGQREIHTQDYKKREYPDGTAKTVYPDGRQETRYSNGRLRVKDKDGNIIIDRLC